MLENTGSLDQIRTPRRYRLQFNTLIIIVVGAISCLCGATAFAQSISIGAVIGGYANRDFVSHYIPISGFNSLTSISDAGGYILGPAVDVHFNRRFSVGLDALYKPLHYKESATFYPDGSIGYAPATVVTWQFPVMARYRIPVGAATVVLEGGPSFRTAGNLNNTAPSHQGISAGAGIEGRWRALTLAPSLRYTRWAKDRNPFPRSYEVQTRSDQVEFLFRLTWGVVGRSGK